MLIVKLRRHGLCKLKHMIKSSKNFLRFLILLLVLPAFAEEPLFKVDTSTEELPREFYELDSRLYELGRNRPYEVVIVLANDLGSGDDYGHTHEFKIVGVTKLSNGIRVRVSYSTDLYTEKIGEKNAEGLTPQHFLDENIGKFMADNIDSGKLYYWKGEIGWHQLNDDPSKNIFRGSTQQILFHKIINPFIPQKQPLNVSEGHGKQNGVLGGISVGVQKNYQHGSLSIRPQAEIGVSKSTLKDADYEYASVSLESTYVVRSQYRAGILLGSEAKRHATGTQYTHSVMASVETKHWVVGAGVYANRGELDNHTRYNKPTKDGKIDPIYMIYGSYRFGRGQEGPSNFLKPKEIISR